MNLPNVKPLLELSEWCTASEISQACGIKDYRLKRNLHNVHTIKLGESDNSNLLYFVPDVIKYLNAKVEVLNED